MMNKIAASVFFLTFFFLTGCTVGEISGDTFYLKNDFSVKLLNDDWQVVRQKNDPLNPTHKPSPFKISFAHKKSNGYIMADSFEMNEVSQARSLKVHADDALARWRATKLSERD